MRKGRDEARAGARPEDVVNVRRSNGKRPYEAAHPEVWPAIEQLVDPVTRGDPESSLRWTCKSTHMLSAELRSGFRSGFRFGDLTPGAGPGTSRIEIAGCFFQPSRRSHVLGSQ